VPGDPLDRSVDSVRLATNARGDAVMAWTTFESTAVSYRPAGGPWERALAAPDNVGSNQYPVVAIGANGDAIVSYIQHDSWHVIALDHPAGAGWQPPEQVTDAPGVELRPDVAVDPHGDATLMWDWWDGNQDWVRVATHQIAPAPPSGDPRPKLSDLGLRESSAFSYRVSEKGRVEFALRRADGKSRRVVATFKAKAGKGANTTKLPSKVRKRLNPKLRYRVSVVAVDRYEQYSRQRSVVFKPAG
jgi:hypothetical protein